MTSERGRNIAASIRQRLLNLARSRDEDFNLVLSQYAAERFLCRLGSSPHRNRFTLKGALLFLVWGGDMHRATRDVDLLGTGSPDPEDLRQVFREIVSAEVEDDGLRFDLNSIQAEQIKPEDEYRGVRLHLRGTLGNARVHVQVDVGFGDVVVPAPIETSLPTMLDQTPPTLRAYPRETVIAEKLQALVELGIANSRMKDFFDLWFLATHYTFQGPLLGSAIEQTFARRATGLPSKLPVGLTNAFASDRDKQIQWKSFVSRGRLATSPLELSLVVDILREFLWPIIQSLIARKGHSGEWKPGAGWRDV